MKYWNPTACHSLVDVQTLVKILERAISTHFNAMTTPTLKPEQLSLPTDPGGYGWHGVTSHLSLPPSKMEGVCQTSVSECAGLVLHAHLLQCLPLCSSLEEEYRMVVKILTWSSQLKPKSVDGFYLVSISQCVTRQNQKVCNQIARFKWAMHKISNMYNMQALKIL